MLVCLHTISPSLWLVQVSMQREKVYYYNYYIILTEELHATCRLIGESFVDKTHAPTD